MSPIRWADDDPPTTDTLQFLGPLTPQERAMTNESGSKRYYEAVDTPPDGYIPGELLSYQGPDPVRVAALTNAVTLVQRWPTRGEESDTARATRVLHVATMFEAYLTGEEDDGPN